MAIPTFSSPLGQSKEIWQSLKEAITNSSGFQRWQKETNRDADLKAMTLDEQVCGYLRSTLETLAY
jgi:hypothetical protein